MENENQRQYFFHKSKTNYDLNYKRSAKDSYLVNTKAFSKEKNECVKTYLQQKLTYFTT